VWKLGKVDAVVSMTDPPLQVAAVTVGSCRAQRRIHWAQDVYPELAEELGVIPRGGLVARVLRAMSTWALGRQDKIVAVGRCMRERLLQRGLDAAKIEVIPNWSPVGAVSAEEVAAMRKKLGWEGKFIALYSGNIGLAHDFETLVEAAKLLEGAGVTMVFAGEGPRFVPRSIPAAAAERRALGLPRSGEYSSRHRADRTRRACRSEQGLRHPCDRTSHHLRGRW
jgi:colanic acid biosynthesis glycosyl transferase WcaI